MTISENAAYDMLFENQLTERYLENVRDDEKTVSLSIVSGNNRPVVGWLMCISGSQKGRALSVFPEEISPVEQKYGYKTY